MRKLFLLFAMLTGALFVSAQESATESDFLSKVTIRPTVGLNFSSIRAGEGGNSSSTLTSFKFGAIADYAMTDAWGFRSGLLVTGQGGKWNQDVGDSFISWSLNATHNPWYLEIPLNAYYRFYYNDFAFTGFAGFPVSIGLFGNQKIEDAGGGNASVGDTSNSVYELMNRFALSFNIGVEATWKKFTLGLEFNRHLTNDSKDGSNHVQVFSVNLGYDFKL